MEKLILQMHNLQQALLTLRESFEDIKGSDAPCSKSQIVLMQDGIIQRFEYCYDGFWKCLKFFLEQMHNIEDVKSPRSVFRTCVECKIFSEEQGDTFMIMVDDRNETTHTYDFQQTRQIIDRIKDYYKLMQTITDNAGIALGEAPKAKKPRATKTAMARRRALRAKRAK